MAESGIKKEFLIDSSDSAKPPVTLQDEPRYFSDIKPKKRILKDIVYEETGEVAKTKVGDPVKLILKTSIYDDGVIVQTTIGEDHEGYQEYLRTGATMPDQTDETTAEHEASDKVKAAIAKAMGKKAPAKSKE